MGNPVQKQIDGILQKEMSRQEFLTLIGAGVLSLVGITQLLDMVSQRSKHQQAESIGYGMTPYGGYKE